MTIEIQLRQTEQLLKKNGLSPAETVQTYLEEALADSGYETDVTVVREAFDSDTQKSVCGDDSAYYGWRDHVNRDGVSSAKDSNVLLTDSASGGCGAVGGKVCTVPGRHLTDTYEYREEGSDDAQSNIHAALHEVAHNLGQAHDHDDELAGKQHRGNGWNEPVTIFGIDVSQWFGGVWHRTPTVAGNGAPNDCGEYVPERRFDDVVYHQYYSDCASESFEVR